MLLAMYFVQRKRASHAFWQHMLKILPGFKKCNKTTHQFL